MMRKASLQWLHQSSKKASKLPKPFIRLANINTIAASKLITTQPDPSLSNTHGFVRKLWPQLQAHHFCTTVPSLTRDFTVTRSEPVLVGPAEPTPRELKPLSDIDDSSVLRLLTPNIQFFCYDPSMKGRDPARVIRDALARALVFYYPLAGRLREGPDGRLYVDCTGEGVLFVEAEADLELAQLGDPPRPPFPWFDRFLSDVPISGGIINSPLIYIQVTRLKCGGFILAFRYNHIITDGPGFNQFLTAVGEIARGAHAPSIAPTWSRELFIDPNPRQAKPGHHEEPDQPKAPIISDKIQRSFFFGSSSLSAIRNLVPEHLRLHLTKFEVLTAYLWRRVMSVQQLDPDETVRLAFTVSAIDGSGRVVPVGYYGNAIVVTTAETSARELCEGSVEFAIGLVKRAKEEGVREYGSWRADPSAIRAQGQRCRSWENCFMVSDTRRFGLGKMDYGWGRAAYAGLAMVELERGASYWSCRDGNGEDGILVSLCLRAKEMERFEAEVNSVARRE